MTTKLFLRLLLTMVISSVLWSCQDDDENELSNLSNQVNQWIFVNMDFWYFWTEEMARDVDQSLDPEDYFDALLFEGDRFSIIVDDFEGLSNSLDGVTLEPGYEVAFFRESDTDNVLAAITYVKDPSPAADLGLLRGDLIQSVNGQSMNIDNFGAVFSQISQNHTIEYLRFNESAEMYEEKQADLVVEQVIENPNFLDSIYTISGDTKVGYYVYNFFGRGVNGGSEYQSEQEQVFASFKAANIEELILDLRYNGGGTTSAARDLASFIAPGVVGGDLFYTNSWNESAEELISNDTSLGPEFLIGRFLDKSVNIGDQLAGRIYVLTGSGTASASELIINGLRPFIDVIVVGDTTVGKNVGSVPFGDSNNENNNYGILPITFQIENVLGQSDYAQGFVPNILVNDLQLPLKQLGDSNEPLLSAALATISGNLGGRLRAPNSGYPTLKNSHQLKPFKTDLFIKSNKFRSK
ncbi:MAG: S41 family peptidase [Bacteroidota bacterium]